MNCRERYLIEKDLPLSFTATSSVEDLSEYGGNNAWYYYGTSGLMLAYSKTYALTVRPVTEFHEISVW